MTGLLLEIPSGVLADLCSRRALIALAPLLGGAAFALWTFAPSYAAFAVGFVLWGAGASLRSGALEALVYTELTHLARPAAPGAAGSHDRSGPGPTAAAAWVTAAYARLIGRSRAAGTTAVMAASLAAMPVLAWGGYTAAGAASILATLLCAAAGRALPAGGERARRAARRRAARRGRRPSRPLRSAVASAAGVAGRASAEIRASGPARRALLVLAVLVGLSGAMDEYVPLLARSTGLSTPAVPLALLGVSAGAVVGGWLAGRRTRHTALALVAAACCMAAGAGSGHPAGLLLLAVAFGVSEWAGAAAEAELQDSVGEEARATVSSFAGFGAESVTVLTFAAYGLGSVWLAPKALFVLAALAYLAAARALRRR
ncbi:MFS transporter [Streptomonospora wellingtoniae]|uniref:MFS transporter n=1 Tax=Streptomonospora wellingtoniae TaxID=3075544 RepID=A0ABU2KXB2_9ACTN|nr:MFS transporter [Streptomonospora sp. DSM 45055]MDT0303683.1 MFS transporter [Streptomonospora sp. DSM 45055]